MRSAGSSLILLASLALLTTGCGSRTVEPEPGFTGIQLTNAIGQPTGTTGDASDDWRAIPEVGFTFKPAFPNPTVSEIMVHFSIEQARTVKLWLESSPGKLERVLYEASLNAGTHGLDVDVSDLAPGIYRVFASVEYDQRVYTTYGDIEVRR